MNTTGTGSEGWFILMTITLLVGVGVLLTGGPTEFVTYIDKTLLRAFYTLREWYQSAT